MEVNNRKFNYVAFEEAQELLKCSREYLYKLVRRGTLKTYYLEKNNSNRGKSYFRIDEIENAFIEKQADEIL